MDREIKFEKRTRKEWLKDIPILIKKLVSDYNFYYSQSYNGYSRIASEITEFIEKNYERKRHTISLYTNKKGTQWYLVVFAKKKISVYYTNDYKPDENWSNIKRFIKKFCLASSDAVKERQEKCLKSNLNDMKLIH